MSGEEMLFPRVYWAIMTTAIHLRSLYIQEFPLTVTIWSSQTVYLRIYNLACESVKPSSPYIIKFQPTERNSNSAKNPKSNKKHLKLTNKITLQSSPFVCYINHKQLHTINSFQMSCNVYFTEVNYNATLKKQSCVTVK